MRKRWVIAATLASSIIGFVPAHAFQEEPGSQGEKPLKAPGAEVVQPGISLEMQKSQDAAKKPDGVRIPGLGIFLPKMDFGLDLMYGAQQPDVRVPDQPAEDVQVLGTVKRRF